MSWTVLLGLIVCNAIWATNPLMGKILMNSYTPYEVAWLRYFLAAVSCVILVFVRRSTYIFHQDMSKILKEKKLTPLIILAGFITFYGSPLAQYAGLFRSTATENSIIVSIEPLSAVLLAWLFIGEKIALKDWIAMLVALIGFLFLSNLRPHEIKQSIHEFNFGNLFLLAVMPMEATYTIISRAVAGRVQAMNMFCLSLIFGITILTLNLIFWKFSPLDILLHLPTLSYKEWFALFWMGPIGTTITYIYWARALENASVFAVSLTLFTQPIVGSITGFLILGEKLNFWQILGALVIILALFMKISQKKAMHDVAYNLSLIHI